MTLGETLARNTKRVELETRIRKNKEASKMYEFLSSSWKEIVSAIEKDEILSKKEVSSDLNYKSNMWNLSDTTFRDVVIFFKEKAKQNDLEINIVPVKDNDWCAREGGYDHYLFVSPIVED